MRPPMCGAGCPVWLPEWLPPGGWRPAERTCQDPVVDVGLSAMVDAAMASAPADGIAVGVARGDTTVFRCRGSLAGTPVAADTVMYGASVTKQMVAFLLALSVQAGRASPEDCIRRWLPELPEWMEGVRLHHLLHHTSGLPDLTSPSLGVPSSNSEVLARFQRLDARPMLDLGARFTYNNAGYVLLAEAVSRFLDRPISQLAREWIFEPLAMTATRLGGEPCRLSGQPEPPGTIGDGGLWTSAVDLTAWLVAMNYGMINSEAVRRVERPGHLADGAALDYAWGIRVAQTPYGRCLSHGGTWANWLAKTVRFPNQRVAVAVLSTGGSEVAISDLGIDLAQLASGTPARGRSRRAATETGRRSDP
jgi:CubicO group peptidase (beta-lactamase class C family)